MAKVLSRRRERNLNDKTRTKVFKSWNTEMVRRHTPTTTIRVIDAAELLPPAKGTDGVVVSSAVGTTAQGTNTRGNTMMHARDSINK